MRVSELSTLGIPESFIEKFKKEKIETLYPPQESAIKCGLFEGKNIVLSVPTAAGKTFTATLAAINKLSDSSIKAVYIVPLVALANEKHTYYKKLFDDKWKVAISIGDLDSADPWLARYDFIVCTTEKLDSLIRHGASWVKEIGLIIVDEVHLLNDISRGPTLEILLTRLREIVPSAQILALSATINNSDELADWLSAELVVSDFRPVKLYEGVSFSDKIHFLDKDDYKIRGVEQENSILENTLGMRKQALFFVSSRRNAEGLAQKLTRTTRQKLTKIEREQLTKLSEDILNVLETPTRQCKKVADCVKAGSAFHHAGLLRKQKQLIEDGFRAGLIKSISATPTLCLSKDSIIWSGMKDTLVQNIKEKDSLFVLSKNTLINLTPEKIHKILNSTKLIEITTVSGHSISLTPNHKILVKRDGKKKLIQVKDCKESDKVATVGKLKIKNILRPRFSDYVKDNKLPFKDQFIPNGVFYTVGTMLGDGYSGAERKNKKIIYKGAPQLVSKDKTIFNKIIEVCKNYKIHYRISENSYQIPILVLTKSNWFREFLVNCGVEKGENKFIDHKLMSAEKSKIISLLRGLFDTDGYVDKSSGIGISSISRKMIRNIQKLLLRLAIISSIRKRKGSKIKIYSKEYKTKPSYELRIMQKRSIKKFYEEIGFETIRKQKSLTSLVEKINSNTHYIECKKCGYKLYRDLFSGRTKEQKEWGEQKLKVIEILGKRGGLESRKLFRILGYEPKKGETRLNHHYELITKRKFGSNEWMWSLNKIGKWFYNNFIKNNKDYDLFFENYGMCPLCNERFRVKVKRGWRDSDFDNDIFWDKLKSISFVNANKNDYVYDVVLSPNSNHDHLFVANGIIVHNSMGINLPAFRVVIRDSKRYYRGIGASYIPVLEYKQFVGRAGRPQYDTFGESILVAKTEDEADELVDRFIMGEPEKIRSKLAVEPVLRMHTLALISSGFAKTERALLEFFSKTFYAYQYGEISIIENKLLEILEQLKNWEFISEKSGKLTPTRIGKRVTELYLDPFTAHEFIKSLKSPKREKKKLHTFSIIQCISNTIEMSPLLYIRSGEFVELNELIAQREHMFLQSIPNEWDLEFERFMRSVKTAMFFEAWTNEKTEDQILGEFRVAPGELRGRLHIADWLIYSLQELALLLGLKNILKDIRKTRVRLRYGVREDLIPLVRLKSIGRVRARRLYGAGLKTVADLQKIPLQSLSRIIGPNIAYTIKNQLGEKVKKPHTTRKIKQSNLEKF